MILLADHDEPSLAAKKKQRRSASSTATSTPKNRVWNFFDSAPGRPGSDSDLSWENATGSVQYSYESASGRGYYYTRDHLGSVREMVNSSGSIAARYSYDPYGRPTLVTGSNLAIKQYAGYYYHAASTLYLTKYRAYDQNAGRWLSRDPLISAESRQGPNLYEYVSDEPLLKCDPLGLSWTIREKVGDVKVLPCSVMAAVHGPPLPDGFIVRTGKCSRAVMEKKDDKGGVTDVFPIGANSIWNCCYDRHIEDVAPYHIFSYPPTGTDLQPIPHMVSPGLTDPYNQIPPRPPPPPKPILG